MKKICLVPVGKVNKKILSYLREKLEREFGKAIEIYQKLSEPDYAYNFSRGQYHASTILKRIEREKPSQCQRILGVTDVDLYIPGLNFVFGQALPLSRVALISLIRLKPEYYGETKDEKLFKERVKKEAIHEIGHTAGLNHCLNSKCVMYFSNSLLDTDKKGSSFCSRCRALFKNEVSLNLC